MTQVQRGGVHLPRADVLDGAAALGLAVLCVVQLGVFSAAARPLLVLAAVVSVLPVAVRRRWPFAATIVVIAASGTQLLLGATTPAFASFLAVIVSCYTLGRHAPVRRAVVGLLLVALLVVGSGIVAGGQGVFDAVYPLVYLGGAAAIGASVRARQAALDRERDQARSLAAAQERAHIARELHDVVAHGLSLMVLQAEGAEEIIDRDAARAKAALRRIQEAGRIGVDEMRRLLDVLRADDADSGTARRGGLDGIKELVADSRATGVPVRLSVTGDYGTLGTGIGLAAYRIVQEALTNALRYGDGRGAAISLGRKGDLIRIQVRNTLPRRPRQPAGTGRGLMGARERAAMYGGEVSAGVLETHGRPPEFVLDATLVVPAGEPA